MTAEIAIMNKDAIALAADSAVTIETESGKKIYNTSNKLFALTKYAPVGIMVYGSANLMGVPWESIVKVYRARLGHQTFPALKDYVGHFLNFLSNSAQLFPPQQQERYFRNAILPTFFKILRDTEKVLEALLKSSGKATPVDIQKTAYQVTKTYEKAILSRPLLSHVKSTHIRKLKIRFKTLTRDTARDVLGNIPMSAALADSLLNVAVGKWCREPIDSSGSGVVIAGFGQSEIFPTLIAMGVDGITEGIARYWIFRRNSIGHDNSASINPFAQYEMVESFMEGIDPNCRRIIEAYWNTITEHYPMEIVTSLKGLTEEEKVALNKKLKTAGENIFREFSAHLNQYQRQEHVSPVVDAIAVLPKDLLAEVAESLVNLTSFKRRISMNSAETVGGPIDVAVISRGDGFVWIKRKHYFKPELNPQFFANILGGSYAAPKEEKSRAQK